MTKTLAQGLAHRYRFQSKFLGILTGDFGPADWHHVAGGAFRNTPHWILAHLVMSRRYTLRVLGVVVEEEPWEREFAPGSKLGDPAGYPPVDELVSAFPTLGDELAARLEGLDDAALAAPTKRAFPDGSNDVLGATAFMNFHEGYHLGQLGTIRRLVGKDGFA